MLPDGPMKLLSSVRSDCKRPRSTVLADGERMSRKNGRSMRGSRSSSTVPRRPQNSESLAFRE